MDCNAQVGLTWPLAVTYALRRVVGVFQALHVDQHGETILRGVDGGSACVSKTAVYARTVRNGPPRRLCVQIIGSRRIDELRDSADRSGSQVDVTRPEPPARSQIIPPPKKSRSLPFREWRPRSFRPNTEDDVELAEEVEPSPLDELPENAPEVSPVDARERERHGREQAFPDFDIPMVLNDRVVAWVEYFQNRHKRFLRREPRALGSLP